MGRAKTMKSAREASSSEAGISIDAEHATLATLGSTRSGRG
jgi:hypothetical protein